MDDLKLPVIKGETPCPKSLSMDDYLEFVNLHLKYTFNRQAYAEWKKLFTVPVRFILR